MPEQGPHEVYTAGRWEIDLVRRELRESGVPVPIGSRAFDIIDALLRSHGEIVSKRDLTARVWSGMSVEDNTLQVHVSAIRRALGGDRFMLQTISGRGYRLQGEWVCHRPNRPSPAADPRPQSAAPVASNFPLASSSLIGRDAAVAHVRDLLSASRAITLTGPGGIGKTRLAIEAARGLLSAFDGDAWVVELASLSDPDLVPSAVAGTIGLGLVAGNVSPASVARVIARRTILLLLDNCEHVIGTVAELVEAIVRTCPRASVLTTSRELLRIEGERAWRVPPLGVPPPDQHGLDALLDHSAVQLFIARLGALQSGFAASPAQLPAIAEICRRLDGIPLAIEFAAARAAAIGVYRVLAGLDDRFRLLTGGRRTTLPRQQTLRATLDWSFDLLEEAEQRLFRQLSVFVAGFTLEAAGAVIGHTGRSLAPVADRIAGLVTKSLIILDNIGPNSRWRMLETTRAYALEKLATTGDARTVQKNHAAWLRDLVVAASNRPAAASQMDLCVREIDNIRAALDWALSEDGDTAIGVELTAAFVSVWMHLSLVAECGERCEQALRELDRAPGLDPRLRVRLHIARGVTLSQTRGLLESTGADLATALAIADGLADGEVQMRALWATWNHHMSRADYIAAQAALDRFAALAASAANPTRVIIAGKLMGYTLHYRGDNRRARRHLEQMFTAAPVLGDLEQEIWFQYDQLLVARTMMARVLWMQGFLDQAARMASDALDEALAADQKLSVCSVFAQAVCPIAIMSGNTAEARRTVAELVAFATRYELPYWRRWGSCLEGERLIGEGKYSEGCDLLRGTLDEIAAMGRDVHSPQFFAPLALGLACIGRLDESLATIDEAIERSGRGGEAWCLPELLRVKGEVILRQADGGAEQRAEACFVAALDTARGQDALFWELLAARSLSRLRLTRSGEAEAHAVLAAVISRFTEGFETPVLRAAEEELSLSRPNPAPTA